MNQPPMSRLVGEIELHDCASISESLGADDALHLPKQEPEIDLALGEASARPALSPNAQSHDDRNELKARGRQMIG